MFRIFDSKKKRIERHNKALQHIEELEMEIWPPKRSKITDTIVAIRRWWLDMMNAGSN